MTYTFDGNNFIVENNGNIIIFKCGSDYIEPTENPDGSLSWSTVGDAAQVNRNLVSEVKDNIEVFVTSLEEGFYILN